MHDKQKLQSSYKIRINSDRSSSITDVYIRLSFGVLMLTVSISNFFFEIKARAVFAAILFSTMLVAGGYLIDPFTINHDTSFDMPRHVNVGLEDRTRNLNAYANTDAPMQFSER